MKTFTSLILRFMLFALAFSAIPARALTLQSPSCTASTITQFQPGYVSCLGSYVGNIDNQLTGRFVLGLKQGNGFSLYLFDGTNVSGGIGSIAYDTNGVKNGSGIDLSHAGYFGPVTPVPEPETYAMILAGLVTLRLLAARRRNNQNKLT